MLIIHISSHYYSVTNILSDQIENYIAKIIINFVHSTAKDPQKADRNVSISSLILAFKNVVFIYYLHIDSF